MIPFPFLLLYSIFLIANLTCLNWKNIFVIFNGMMHRRFSSNKEPYLPVCDRFSNKIASN